MGELNFLLWLPLFHILHGIFDGSITHWQIVSWYLVSQIRLPLRYAQQLTLSLSFSWAIAIGCHAACKNFGGLMAVRYLLGVAEAAAIPSFSLMTGMWYKREEHPLRHGFWFLGTSIGIMLAGLVSFSIAHIKTKPGPWRVRLPQPGLMVCC